MSDSAVVDWPYPMGPVQGPAVPPPPPWGNPVDHGPLAGLPLALAHHLRNMARYSLHTREDLIACALERPDDLLRIRNIGPRAVEEIVRWARSATESLPTPVRDAPRLLPLYDRIVQIAPGWRSLDGFGRWLRERQAEADDGEVPPLYWEANRILVQWLDGRANDHMTVLRLRRLTEVPDAA